MNHLSNPIYQTTIQQEWTDYNNHLNVAYYLLIFDKAAEELMESIELGEHSAKTKKISWMVMENHMTFNRELVVGQEVEVHFRLIDHDHKRLHFYMEMYAVGEKSYLAATLEEMIICADLANRKSTEFPNDVLQNIEQIAKDQTDLQMPDNIGRKIGIRRTTA